MESGVLAGWPSANLDDPGVHGATGETRTAVSPAIGPGSNEIPSIIAQYQCGNLQRLFPDFS